MPSRASVARNVASAFSTPGFRAYVRVLADVPDWRSASSHRCRISASTWWIPSGSILAIVASCPGVSLIPEYQYTKPRRMQIRSV